MYDLDNELKLYILTVTNKYKPFVLVYFRYKNSTLHGIDNYDLSVFLKNAIFNINDNNIKYTKEDSIGYEITIDKGVYRKDFFGSSDIFKYYDKEQSLMYCIAKNFGRDLYYVELYHKNFKNTYVATIWVNFSRQHNDTYKPTK